VAKTSHSKITLADLEVAPGLHESWQPKTKQTELFGIQVVVDKNLDDAAFTFTGNKLVVSQARFDELKKRIAAKEFEDRNSKRADPAIKEFVKRFFGLADDPNVMPAPTMPDPTPSNRIQRRIKT